MRNIASLWHSIYQRLEADSDKLENSSVVAGSRRRVVRFTARAPPRRPGGRAGWLGPPEGIWGAFLGRKGTVCTCRIHTRKHGNTPLATCMNVH